MTRSGRRSWCRRLSRTGRIFGRRWGVVVIDATRRGAPSGDDHQSSVMGGKPSSKYHPWPSPAAARRGASVDGGAESDGGVGSAGGRVSGDGVGKKTERSAAAEDADVVDRSDGTRIWDIRLMASDADITRRRPARAFPLLRWGGIPAAAITAFNASSILRPPTPPTDPWAVWPTGQPRGQKGLLPDTLLLLFSRNPR